MGDSDRHPALSGPGMMLLGAAIFGYFGFFMGLSHVNTLGQFVLFFAMLDWTLKATAVGFVIAAALTSAAPLPGNLLYCLLGIASALMFVAIAAMDVMDDQNAAAAPPILLLIFAAWNGFGSWSGLRAAMMLWGESSRRETMDLPSDGR